MANRVYFASQGIAINEKTVYGAQSVGISINYSLEQAFQLGVLGIYDNIVTDGEVTVTCSKNLDGKPLIQTLASTSANIRIASSDAGSALTASVGTGNQTSTEISGASINSVSYNFPAEGWCTEEISFIADNKSVGTGAVTAPTGSDQTAVNAYRHHVTWSGALTSANVTNISMSTDFGLTPMFKLGQFKPHTRYEDFPVETTVEFTVDNTSIDDTVVDLDGVTCTGSGNLPGLTNIGVNICEANSSSTNAEYSFVVNNCRLSSVTQDGGDTGGGNASTTYTYISYDGILASGPAA